MIRGLLKNRFVLLTLIFSGVMIFCVAGLPLVAIYRQGWEVKSDIVAMEENSRGWVTTETGSEWAWIEGNVFGDSQWVFDMDHPDYGLPDLEVTVSDVRINESPWPYADLENLYDESWKYTVTYREYLFDVQVRTWADSKIVSSEWGKKWQHETACPYEWHDNVGGEGNEYNGLPFQGSVYLRFAIHPFGLIDFNEMRIPDYEDTTPTTGTETDGWTFTAYWPGIMNAKLHDKVMGKVATGDNLHEKENHHGYVKGLPSTDLARGKASNINMYQDDGSFGRAYSEVPWAESMILDPDIRNVVVVQVPFEIMAGAYEDYNPYAYLLLGSMEHLYPVDYFFTATIRMETFIVKEYQAVGSRDPVSPVNPSKLANPEDYYPVHIPSWLEMYWGYIVLGIIICGIIFFAMWLLGGAGIGVILMSLLRITRLEGGRIT